MSRAEGRVRDAGAVEGGHGTAARMVLGVSVALALCTALPAAAHTSQSSKSKAPAEADAKPPMTLVISLSKQKMNIYRGTDLLQTSRVSTGKPGYATPTGIFSILQKKKWHRSNIYSAAPMPFMQRLTWSGIALHAGYVPNRPASHGCIRLPRDFATKLFRKSDVGAHVVIVKEDAAPEPVSHPALFQPLMPASPAPSTSHQVSADRTEDGLRPSVYPVDAPVMLANADATDTGIARSDASAVTPRTDSGPQDVLPEDANWFGQEARWSDFPLRILITRRTGRERLKDVQRLLTELRYTPGEIDGYMGPDTANAVRAFQENHNLPANGIVSEEFVNALYSAAGRGEVIDGHIYVRQYFRRVFDAPMPLRGGDKPLGDHLFTAKHFDAETGHVQWMVLSPGSNGTSAAAEALDRVDVPDNVRQLIAAMLTPGSSLIVSDRGLSKETHPKGTDFVVLTK